jgi:hypothetical protein
MCVKSVMISCLFLVSMTAIAFEATHNKHIAQCSTQNLEANCKILAHGGINLAHTHNIKTAKHIFFKLNPEVKGVLRLYQTKAVDMDAIKGEFLFENTSPEQSYISYKVIFKDKKGAVAQTEGHILLPKGKQQTKRFSTIDLSPQDMENIETYEIKLIAANHNKLHKH